MEYRWDAATDRVRDLAGQVGVANAVSGAAV